MLNKTLLLLLLPFAAFSQAKDANTIIIKGVSFNQVVEALLDSGYTIEKKDAELRTVRTEAIRYPRYWNGAYKISVRVKDSTAYFTGIYKCPYYLNGDLEKNWDNEDRIYYHTNKKGEVFPKSMIGYPFLLMNQFVKSFGKEIIYVKQ